MSAVFSMLLTSCKEIHGTISFEKDSSGVLSLRIVYPESLAIKNIKDCRKYLTTIKWNDYLYEGLPSINNPSGGDQCTYSYSFNDLDEVEKLHRGLNLKLDRLSIDDDRFIYKANDKTCINNPVDFETKSITWTVKPPGNKNTHNAAKIIGDKLTWNISGLDCYNLSVESLINNKSLDDKIVANTSTSSEKSEKQPLDLIGVWTTIGASIATMIAAIIAYTESKKKK